MDHAIAHYVEAHGGLARRLPGQDLPWLAWFRKHGLERFAALGFPDTRLEDWKYTRVTPITKRAFTPAIEAAAGRQGPAATVSPIEGLDCYKLAFTDGIHVPSLSTPPPAQSGLTVGGLAAMIEETPETVRAHLGRIAGDGASGFSALNAAFLGDGALIHVAPGQRLDKPVVLEFHSSPGKLESCVQPRILVVAEDGAEAVVIEHYTGEARSVYFTNAVTEVSVGAHARIEHHKLQDESRKAFHVATLAVDQAAGSRFQSHSFSIGGALVRNDIRCVLGAEGGDCELNGLFLATARQHVDYHTLIEHARPECTSREHYKGILDGHARGVFNGSVRVHTDAQKSDARQASDNLVLSRDAEIDTKPELEIYADDVKCTHGATVGQLDERMVFYLRSRGIDESAARGLLTYGFAHEVVSRVALEPLRAAIEREILAWLPEAGKIREMVA